MLAIGGGWGRLIGMAVQGLASGVAGAPSVSLPAYTIVGAAAMLGEEEGLLTMLHMSKETARPADVSGYHAHRVTLRTSCQFVAD